MSISINIHIIDCVVFCFTLISFISCVLLNINIIIIPITELSDFKIFFHQTKFINSFVKHFCFSQVDKL